MTKHGAFYKANKARPKMGRVKARGGGGSSGPGNPKAGANPKARTMESQRAAARGKGRRM